MTGSIIVTFTIAGTILNLLVMPQAHKATCLCVKLHFTSNYFKVRRLEKIKMYHVFVRVSKFYTLVQILFL